MIVAVISYIYICASVVCATPPLPISDCVPGEVAENLKRHYPEGKYTNRSALYCNNTHLQTIPEFNSTSYPLLYLLDLSDNNITTLKNNTFQRLQDLRFLLLTNNNISVIQFDAFDGLQNLLLLSLKCNSLTSSRESFLPDTFRHLGNLIILGLKQNDFMNFTSLEYEMKYLPLLQIFAIEGCQNCTFGSVFSTLNKLSNVSLSTENQADCQIRRKNYRKCNLMKITREMFDNINHVKRLWLSDCSISEIEPETFKFFQNLEMLDISHNEQLGFKGMKNATCELRSKAFKKLNLNKIHKVTGRGEMLRTDDVLCFPLSMEVLHIDINKIEVIEKGALLKLPTNLSEITASGNRFVEDEYFQEISNMSARLKSLDISRQHLNYDPFQFTDGPSTENPSEETQMLPCSKNFLKTNEGIRFLLPPYTEEIKWRKSFLYGKVNNLTVEAPMLRNVDLSFNLLFNWTGPVNGVEGIEYLDLSENYCQYVSCFFFANFRSLKWLNVSGNFLGYSIRQSKADSGQTFHALKNLQKLYLSANRIQSLPNDLFNKLINLEVLDLSWNVLSSLSDVDFTHLERLQYLNLSNNYFKTIRSDVRSSLNHLLQIQQLTNQTSRLRVRLVSNSLSCLCPDRNFIDWVDKSGIIIEFKKSDKCQLPDTSDAYFLNIENMYKALDKQCRSYTVEIVCGVAIGVSCCTLLISYAIYRKRWKLRHIYYSKRRRHVHTGYERLFDNDAFISYAGTEGSFIKQKLVPALEGVHGLKVWVADRDAKAGVSIAENITHAIYNSKKAVIVLSKKYLKESWCDYELNMTRIEAVESKRKMICFIQYEDIPAKLVPLDVMRLIDAEESVDYPEHPQHLESFWTAVANFIKKG